MTRKTKKSDEDRIDPAIDIEQDIDDTLQDAFLKAYKEIKQEEEAKSKGKSDFPWAEGGEGFKAVRNRIGLNQQAFAKLLGTSKTTLSTWETGQFRPRFQTLVGIKYQLLDFGKQIGIEELGDLINLEKFGYTKRGQSLSD